MSLSLLQNLRIILVEPAGALNVGSVARVMKNMGLDRLFLVNPHCDPWGEEARRMAVHGRDVLEKAQCVRSLPEALQGCHRAIATTSRSRHLSAPLELPKVALPWLLAENLTSALIFGPEDRGLNNEELNYAQRFLGIPANPEYPSLNLAQAVAVCAYELYQIAGEQQEVQTQSKIHPPQSPLAKEGGQAGTSLTKGGIQGETLESQIATPASLDRLESYYQHLERVLLEIGYLYPHTATARMEKFRRLFHRATLTQEEVALLRGILRQTEWAIQEVRADEARSRTQNENLSAPDS
jgi:tRNA/rRNA methyltransferase